ncbi:MAG: DsbA family protein [Deltaproteobacteria bacterium]|nr:DsbA family protein [Deltaproteobacteria bacterium]
MSLLIALFAACSQEGAQREPLVAPGPAPAALVAPAWAAEGMEVVAYWQGGQLSYDDVTGPMKPQLNQMLAEYMMGRYDAEYQAAQSAMDEKILEAEAKAQKLGAVEDLLKKEVSDKVAKATEAEIDEAYQMLQRKLRGQSKEEARPTLEAAVGQKKAGERYGAYIEELRGKYQATVQLPFPDVPRLDVSVDDDPSVGPADAPITIIQFAEYQCPYCGKARESLDRVEKEYAGKVRLVFRDFPLDFHPRAVPAAVAANCAGKQEKYWPVHDAIMKDQQSLADADLLAIARAAGVDIASWEECRKDPAMEAEVQKDLDDGRKVGVSGTPAFFINGIFISGAQPFEKFKAIIDAELKRKG